MGQVAHIRVYAPDGEEVECFRANVVFDGEGFQISLPISYSEGPGTYKVDVEYPVTGMTARARFEVLEGN